MIDINDTLANFYCYLNDRLLETSTQLACFGFVIYPFIDGAMLLDNGIDFLVNTILLTIFLNKD